MTKIFKDRIFYLALIASAALHIFWLSAVTVAMPRETKPIKFSRVSFLGPIAGKGALDIGVDLRERSFLEKRYLDSMQKSQRFDKAVFFDKPAQGPKIENAEIYNLKYKGLITLIENILGESKLEPPCNAVLDSRS